MGINTRAQSSIKQYIKNGKHFWSETINCQHIKKVVFLEQQHLAVAFKKGFDFRAEAFH